MNSVIDDGSVGKHTFSHVDWFVYLASVNGSLRITPGVPLGVNAEGELCFSLEDAEHAVTFFYGDEKLLVKPEVGELRFDDELVSQRILVEPNSTFYLGELPVFVTTSPVLKNTPTSSVEKLVEPSDGLGKLDEPIRVEESGTDNAVAEDVHAEDILLEDLLEDLLAQDSLVKDTVAKDTVAQESTAKVAEANSSGANTTAANVVRMPNRPEPALDQITVKEVARPARTPKKALAWPRKLLWSGVAAILLAVVAIGLAPLFWGEPTPAVTEVRSGDSEVIVTETEPTAKAAETLPTKANVDIADAPDDVPDDAVAIDKVAVVTEAPDVVTPISALPEAPAPVETLASSTPIPEKAPATVGIKDTVDVPSEVPVEATSVVEAAEAADIPATPARSFKKVLTADRLPTNLLPELPTSAPAYAAIEDVNTEHLLVAAQWALRNGDGPGALILLEAITSKSPNDAQAIELRDQLRLILGEVELNKN